MILEAIGETGFERSAQLNAALAANDRLKYYFSLLQMVIAHADHPDQPDAAVCGIDERPAPDRRAS